LSRIQVIEEFIGSTLRVTWVNSGVNYSPLHSALFDASSTLVHSISHSNSGNGFYYADHPLPATPQWLMNRQMGVTGANTYAKFQLVNVQHPLAGA
jgi:hypothetical protein